MKISMHLNSRKDPYDCIPYSFFDRHGSDDATLESIVEELCYHREGFIVMEFNDVCLLKLDLEWNLKDLGYELPEAIEYLTVKKVDAGTFDIWFPEQGEDFHLTMTKIEEKVKFDLIKGSDCRADVANMVCFPLEVPTDEVLKAFLILVNGLLQEAIACLPNGPNKVLSNKLLISKELEYIH
ncbi:hypothetical protein [Kordiimonas sp. SCSIO 12610]|uniref:hypothetical protein n=1 Tax=Kordiimonas sp. SCSIO 12610 TaxID=2829597 RepID=UPI002108F1BF|nr:hypothetical protein [Kordiimonas sp. SCSIO 12610]UTW54718.1 hypothetical protein KFF44_13030 [Kordiimonas sp. SCSIO 12610]